MEPRPTAPGPAWLPRATAGGADPVPGSPSGAAAPSPAGPTGSADATDVPGGPERARPTPPAATPAPEAGPLPATPGGTVPHHRAPVRRPYRGPHPKASLTTAMLGVLLTGAMGLLVGVRAGAVTIAVTLAVVGTWRALAPRANAAAGIVVRSKLLDVATCWGLAAMILFLALTIPLLG
ncbi:DUF3017 domain-containing protein [Puerhibacterium sp. TATVAM-FAB25]|uniref:DUF3017 domain-containing protein n=1 Tax=Puerhibacterium sp. TATVAM-FAB25 TaxID=3093699 RepID=UPI00397BEF68